MGFPLYGVLGALAVVVAEAVMFARVDPVFTYFTAIVWTGYILFADALVYRLRGESLLTRRRSEFAVMALWSVPAWLLFEAYNLHLQNWRYVGLPDDVLLQALGYGWSFATILPGVLETAELVAASGLLATRPSIRWQITPALLRGWLAMGLALLVAPLLVPAGVAGYLFGLIWIGVILALEPINYRLGAVSLLRDLERGSTVRLRQLLVAGALCGLLWEFWNYWAGAKWYYSIPYPLDFGLRVFEMPLLGFLGFPPFAVECFCLHQLAWRFVRGLSDKRNPLPLSPWDKIRNGGEG
ncbi:MAG: hypothetical protein HYY04_04365 [Chloroflexi bacterium]|nr:hypothetical protein [Chloroflexota bacterium]